MSGPIATILPRRKRSPRGRNNSAQKYAGRSRMARSPGFSVYSDSLFRFRLRLLREFRKRAAEFLGGQRPASGRSSPHRPQADARPLGKAPRRRRAARPSPRQAVGSPARAPPALRWSMPWNRPCPWSWPLPRRERLTHMAQELRNTGAEAFCFPKDPDADNRP